MTERISYAVFCLNKNLHRLVNERIAPGTGIQPSAFWSALDQIIVDLGPKLEVLLKKRDELQAKLDEWCRSLAGSIPEPAVTKKFLLEIGYLVPEGEDFEATTS